MGIKTPTRSLTTIAEAAEQVGCSPKTIRRWIADGRLPAVRLGARLIRIDVAELEALMRPIPTVRRVGLPA